MKTSFILSIFTLIFQCSYSQQLSLAWAKQYGGPDTHHCQSMCNDPFGNIISVGNFSGYADFNPGSGSAILTSNGLKDAYVGKLDSNGNFIWAVSFGGSADEMAWDVASDYLGNIIVVGSFKSSSMDADPGPGAVTLSTTSYNGSAFIIKLDADGNYLWSVAYSSPLATSYAAAKAVDVDSNGNISVCGEMNVVQFDSIDFNPGAATEALDHTYHYFIVKFNASGLFADLIGLQGDYNMIAEISDMEFDGESNIYFSGHFYYSMDFDQTATNYSVNAGGYYTSFVCKLNASGDLLWVAPISDTNGSITSTALHIDNEGHIYLAGTFQSTADFNPELLGINELVNTSGTLNGYLLKLDNLGNFIYAKNLCYGGTGVINDIAHDEEANAYLIGQFSGTADMNPETDVTENYSSLGGNDAFVTKLNGDGTYLMTHIIGSTGQEEGSAVLFPSQSAGFIAAGAFSSAIDVDPGSGVFNLTSGGNTDAFIIKFSSCLPQSSSFNANGCGSYAWNDEVYTLPGAYEQTFLTSSGCDSVVTLNLTIGNATSSTLNIDACSQYFYNNEEISTPGNYIYTFTNSQGCDSVVYLNLTLTPHFELTLGANGNTITATSIASSYQWFNCVTEQLIEGATSATYSPTESGSYGVYAYFGPCMEVDCTDFTFIQVEEQANSFISIYPNPAEESVNINTSSIWKNADLRIVNSTGSLVMSKKMNGSLETLNVSSLPSGVYFVQIHSNDKQVEQMLLVE